jgi:NADH:ubiquinone oxidoreductase subunit K
MAGFFDYIPMIAIILFAVGVVGVMVYERVRTKNIEESSS